VKAPGDPVLRRLVRARDLLHAHPDRAHSLDTLAREANMSKFHFLRSFRGVYGVTPRALLTEVRLVRARELLATGASVTEACAAVGCESLGSFSTAFHARFGESPRSLQRRLRAVTAVPARIAAVVVPGCFVAFFGAFAR